MFRVMIGLDRRYVEMAHVCAFSILKHATIPVNIQFLELGHLKTVYGFKVRLGTYERPLLSLEAFLLKQSHNGKSDINTR
mgnify:CR=1 FL=1